MAEETMTRQQAKQRFSRIRDKIRGHLNDIQVKLDAGTDLNKDFRDKVLEFSKSITAYSNIYDNKITKKEFELPEISTYKDTSNQKSCCKTTDAFIQEKASFDSHVLALYNIARSSTITTASFVNYDMADYIEAVESVADNLDRLIALLDDTSSSSQDINNAIREYNQTCDTWESFKRQIKSGIRTKINEFGQTINGWDDTAISILGKHVQCHKNLFIVSFHYYDASDFMKDKIVLVEKDRHIDPDEIPTPKNSGNFKFLSWKDKDGNPFDPRTATITNDVWIEGKWKIGATIDWMLDGESKVVHDMGEFEEGTDCTTAVEEQLNAYNTAWGHTAVVPDIGSFDDLIVSRNNYEFAIKGYTKTFDFRVEYRKKTLEGWSGWTDQPGTKKKVRMHGVYDTANLPINYQKAVEDDYYINEPKTKKITYNTDASDDWDSVTADGAIRFDVYPLYKVRYQDGKGNTVKTVSEIEIGQRFVVDRHAPAAWPAGSYVDGNDVYRLKIGDEYTHKGETMTASADTDIIPNYERINKATVIFSLNGKDDPDGVQWGAKNHKYEDEDAETSFSTYSEISSPEYPSVLEAVMATATPPLSTDDKEEYENSIWDNSDPDIGWYLGGIKITTGSLIKTAPGDNILVFKGKVYQKTLTVFCFSPDDKQTLQEHGIEWQTKTIDGKPYEGYIKYTYDKNPEFPEAQQCGPYYTIWGETVDKYTVNFCRLEEAFAGYIIPKIVSEDESSIYIQMDTSTNLVDSEIVDKIVPTEKLKDIIEDKFSKDKEIVIRNSSNTNVAVWGRDVADSRIDSHIATTINNKQYAVINFNPCGYDARYLTYVYKIKDNAEQRYKNYPAYESYTSLKKIDDDYKYELIVVRNITESGEQWGRGDIVDPIYSSQNQQ